MDASSTKASESTETTHVRDQLRIRPEGERRDVDGSEQQTIGELVNELCGGLHTTVERSCLSSTAETLYVLEALLLPRQTTEIGPVSQLLGDLARRCESAVDIGCRIEARTPSDTRSAEQTLSASVEHLSAQLDAANKENARISALLMTEAGLRLQAEKSLRQVTESPAAPNAPESGSRIKVGATARNAKAGAR